jgi:hypothetical protein
MKFFIKFTLLKFYSLFNKNIVKFSCKKQKTYYFNN